MNTRLSGLSGRLQAVRRALIVKLRNAERVLRKRLQTADAALEAAADAEGTLNDVIEEANGWLTEAHDEVSDRYAERLGDASDGEIADLEEALETYGSEDLREVDMEIPSASDLSTNVPTTSEEFERIGEDRH